MNVQDNNKFCPECGMKVDSNMKFCPKCGASFNITNGRETNSIFNVNETDMNSTKKVNKNYCNRCDTELKEGQEFCYNCGEKAENIVNNEEPQILNEYNENFNNTKVINKKKKNIIFFGAIISIALFVAIIVLSPKIFVSVDDLIMEGNYQKAYQKASNDRKMEVLAQNAITHLSVEVSKNLTDPSSFILNEAYYYASQGEEGIISQWAVLNISSTNALGQSITNYWCYYGVDDIWGLMGQTETLKYVPEKDNFVVYMVLTYMINGDESIKLNDSNIYIINEMFRNNVLDKVKLIEYDSIDKSIIPEREDNTNILD